MLPFYKGFEYSLIWVSVENPGTNPLQIPKDNFTIIITFTDEAAKVQEGEVTCPKSHNSRGRVQILTPNSRF